MTPLRSSSLPRDITALIKPQVQHDSIAIKRTLSLGSFNPFKLFEFKKVIL